MLITKEEILGAEDLPSREVEVPEWSKDKKVRLGTMTGVDRDAYEASIYDVSGKDVKIIRENFRSKLLARTIIDEKGKRLFTEKEVELLGKKSSKALDRLFPIAQELNGLRPEDTEKFTKNSKGEEEDTSTSTSPKS